MSKKVRRAPQEQLTRKERSRLEKERHMQKLLMWGFGIVGVLVIGVLGYGVAAETILKPREPVAIVEGRPITTSEFQARVKFQRLQLRNQLLHLYQQQQFLVGEDPDPDTQSFQEYIQSEIGNLESQLAAANAELIGQQVLDQMIRERLVKLEAERRGIEVPTDAVQDLIHEIFGYTPDAASLPPASSPITETDPTASAEAAPVPTEMTEAEFRELYNEYMLEGLRPLGISEQQYRSWIEASLLIEALQEDMRRELPREAEQAKLDILLLNSEQQAARVAERLDAGDSFDALAEEVEADEEEPGYRSELDWIPTDMLVSQLGEELADLALDLDIDGYTDPIAMGEEDPTYYIMRLAGREVRALDEALQQQMVNEAYRSWLEAQQTFVERRPISGRVPTEP